MARIHVMDAHLADLIAAGEVVERPGSVVKELLENAVDAGARFVRVEIEAGGMRLIRVTDDGCGMSAEDAPTAFLRHATSKLTSEDELETIETMGFRGEALAAIAAVSRVELLTRQADTDEGTRLTLEAGAVTDCGPAGCPVGTAITVRDLFYNTPARLKYMKRDSAEASNVLSVVQKQAMAHPEVSYVLVKDGAEQLRTPGSGDLKAAVYSVLGRDTALGMTAVESSWNGVELRGFVSLPTACRGSRTYQHFFVGGRPIQSRTMMAALEEAYKNQMMTGKYPACVLHLTLLPAQVDVNVHPAKTEVRFLSEKTVFDTVYYGVLEALRAAQDRPELTLSRAPSQPAAPAQPEPAPAPEPTPAAVPAKEPSKPYAFLSQFPESSGGLTLHMPEFHYDGQSAAPRLTGVRVTPRAEEYDLTDEAPEPAAAPAPAPEPEQLELPVEKGPTWRVVGEVLKTYIVVEDGDEVLFIDKHAAHERILFERYRAMDHAIMSQTLLTPQVLTLDSRETTALLENPEVTARYGYEVEDFGGGAIVVRRAPSDLQPGSISGALEELAATLLEGGRADEGALRDERLHTVACKAAIKAGDDTDPAGLRLLADEVMSRDDLKHCPHGRPICIRLTRTAIEKEFKRIV